MKYLFLLLIALPVLAADDPVQMVPLLEARQFFDQMEHQHAQELRDKDAVIKELLRKLGNINARECV